jgi:hypothetical protein
MKTCSVCHIEKEIEEFYKDKHDVTGRSCRCIACDKIKNAKHREKNREKAKETSSNYYYANREEILKEAVTYRIKARPRVREWWLARYHNDPYFRLTQNLRGRFLRALEGNYKGGHAVRDLGCTIEFFKEYLESLFQPGMTWDNWGVGKGKWNIDHHMPLSAFDLTDRQHVLLAVNYLNLRPMWFEENMAKGSKVPNYQLKMAA